MPLPTPQRSDTIDQTSWDSGMITSLPPEELPEDAAALIENFEFDDIGNLKSRTTPELFVDTTVLGTVTSIFVAKYSDGTTRIYYTQGTTLFRLNSDGSGRTNITGAFAFPNGNRWFWAMFDDFAIGIHGSATERPIKIDSAGTVTTLNANAPFANHGVVWNSRLWLSGVGANQNTVFGSAINDPEDWVTAGDAGIITLGIDIGDGDRIFALSVFRGDMMAYKVNKINIVSAISAPATLPANLRVDLYTDKLGCAQPATIQSVLDDQLFLSAAGVTSLSLAPLGDVKGVILSNKISELGKVVSTSGLVNISACAINITVRQQYLIHLPASIGNGVNTTWVMDYSDITQRDVDSFPKIRWCKFTKFSSFNSGINSAFASFAIDGLDIAYLIGTFSSNTNTNIIDLYEPTTSTSFFGTHDRRLITRSFGNSKKRSLWYRFGLSFIKLTTTVAFDVKYYFENYVTLVPAPAGTFSHSSDGSIANTHRVKWFSFRKNDSGRKANLVQIEVLGTTSNQGFTIKSVSLEHTKLSHRRSQTAFVSD